jgi:hypothetical protein
MFTITVIFTAIFMFPAVKFAQRSKLVNFYWVGFWGFLSWIAALSGARGILDILGYDVDRFAGAVLTGITASFVIFVMFAWARLTLLGVTTVAKKAA